MSRPFAVAKWLLIIILIVGAYFRASGLFRGLERGVVFHPDSPKQVRMLDNYLHGNYVQYYDSRFYDGYPYGLNRADECLIRGVSGALVPLARMLDTRHDKVSIPSRHELFYWGRVLRLLYGLVVVLLVYATVMRLSGHAWAALTAAALYAVAPIGVAVSHSVTGDIGVDLFLAVAVFCASVYTTGGRFRWMAAFSAACGMAFACKFQGMLGLWVGGVILLGGMQGARRPVRLLLRQASVMVSAFVAGVFALTPALLLQPEKTWRNMRINFTFIRDYGVSAEILEKPLHARIWFGLRNNVPLIADALGYVLLLLTAAALLLSLWMLVRKVRRAERVGWGTGDARRCWAFSAVTSFPWMALFLATALKPEVQPFHFSFLLPTMAVSVGMLVAAIKSPVCWRSARLAVCVLVPLCLAELLYGSLQENFFWRRPETSELGAVFSKMVFGHPYHGTTTNGGRRVIKSFYAEPAQMPVFRNRPSGLEHPDAAWWRAHGQLPVPAVPFPMDLHWIFMNGPVFPRNDRMFAVPAGGRGVHDRVGYGGSLLLVPTWSRAGLWTEKTLVFSRPPEALQIGLRTGRWPARCTVDVRGAASQDVFLPPHSQVILPVASLHARPVGRGGSETAPVMVLVPIRLRAQLGPVWATLLDDPDALAIYRRFGPEGDAFAFEEPVRDGVVDQLQALCYLGNDQPTLVGATLARLSGGEQPLAAGPYVLEAKVVNTDAETARLKFSLKDISGGATGVEDFETDVGPESVQKIVWRFEKCFAPYDAELMVATDGPQIAIASWTLRPDAVALHTWCPLPAGSQEDGRAERSPETPLNVDYPGLGVLRGLLIPDETEADKPFSYAIRFDLDPDIPHKTFHESVFFLHIINAQDEIVMALDYPLRKASYSDQMINWQQSKPLPSGQYKVVGGVYNARTRERFHFTMMDGTDRQRRRHSFVMKPSLVVP